MEKELLKLQTSIAAPKEKIWQVLLQDETYRQWTAPFCEGSYYEADDFNPGSKVLFLSPGGEGMVSRVAEHKPNEMISFEHLGVVKNGVEDLDGPEVQAWKGSRETYRVTQSNGQSELVIEQDIDAKYADSFTSMWKAALQKLKQLAEG